MYSAVPKQPAEYDDLLVSLYALDASGFITAYWEVRTGDAVYVFADYPGKRRGVLTGYGLRYTFNACQLDAYQRAQSRARNMIAQAQTPPPVGLCQYERSKR